MFGDFLIKKMLKRQGVSEEQAAQVMGIVQQNPALFKQIAEEIKARVEKGENEQSAAVAVMAAHQEELAKLKP